MKNTSIRSETIELIQDFIHERNWEQFHNPKDLAISINLEAAELLEMFQWSRADTSVRDKLPNVKEELADTLIYCIIMALNLNLDINEIIRDKMIRNDKKYPKEAVCGSYKKYTKAK